MSQYAENKKITLVVSGEGGGYLHIPLSILCLAESLIHHGFEPQLVDLRVRDLVEEDVRGALFLGVSHMTGSMQIPGALKSAKMARQMHIPVVFGGTRPSILTEQTAAHPLVDIVVKGDGEDIVVAIAEHFQGKRDLKSIKGIAYKDPSGTVLFTGDAEQPAFDRLTYLPYDLLPINKYQVTKADFGYQSSRGYLHRCAFCAEISLFDRRWRAKPGGIMIDKFSPARIFFVDSNFFCNKKRVEEFCNLIIERNIKTHFFGECRFDYFSKYDMEFINLIQRAGFNEIEFGGESGSDATLAYIKKDISSEQIVASIENVNRQA